MEKRNEGKRELITTLWPPLEANAFEIFASIMHSVKGKVQLDSTPEVRHGDACREGKEKPCNSVYALIP